ncbi:ATP11 protein-domain-containing protein [Parachaetomium inaequale]|uniref:ATP11 protein-domain-containing protein n=1 Tax=Parachaetomium inaequale TaxID=2588326 RepID=A0AAN6SQV8_9PEZI|nr:ATP11 protein-domain-containing protein [Parachaetomium inaequale]
MAAARVPMLRHLLSSQTRALRASNQRRWAQVHDVRFLATTQQPRNILEKYRHKLEGKARDEGHADIDSLKAAYADKIQTLRRETDAVTAPLATPPPNTPPTPHSQPQQQQQQQQQQEAKKQPFSSSSSSSSPTGIKPLSQILNLPKASTLPTKELTAIWRLHHAALPNSLCATIPASTFTVMEDLARANPQFVLPVPHPEQGAEMHFLQWTWDAATRSATVLFTQLAEYKARGEFAAPHTTVTHYKDLMGPREGEEGREEEGVVLMQGTVVEDRGVKVDNARWLVMCLQRFYGGWDGVGGEGGKVRAEERRRLLEWFGRGDGRFSVDKLMEEAERMG